MAVSATVLMLHADNRGPPLVLLNARALPWLVVIAGRRCLDLQRSRQPLLPWLGHLASAAPSSAWQRGWLVLRARWPPWPPLGLGGRSVRVRWKALFAVREGKGESLWCVLCTGGVRDGR